MFRALLAYPKDSLHKRHLVYCVRVMSVGCTRFEAEVSIPMHARNIQGAVCEAPP
jgi:hypothetical protein